MLCGCCGNTDFIEGARASSLGPCSLMWCKICLAMQAEPDYIVEFQAEFLDDYITFNRENGSYVNKKGEVIPLTRLDDRKYNTRQEFVDSLSEEEREMLTK